jgi:hypothetical protein
MVGMLSPREKIQGREARWWRAVSQRVPRDAYRHIAKTDVLGSTPHPGRRDAVYPPEVRIYVNVAAIEGQRGSRR